MAYFTKRTINPIDLIFLSIEKRRQPMHIAGLLLFKIPDDAPQDFMQKLVEHFRQSQQEPIPPYCDYLKGIFWEKDEDFDLDNHFRHISLPKPGRIRDLLTYISQEHSIILDRHKPLWSCTLIEGIENNRFAIYTKIHHALADGIGAMRMLQKSLSTSADDPHFVPLWCLNPNQALQHQPHHSPLKQTVKSTWQSSRKVLGQLIQNHQSDDQYIPLFKAPKSILNQRIHASRRFSAQSYDLQRLQHIAQYFNVKINDVILAICSGALRLYLQNHAQLPEKPLIAMVPASLHNHHTYLGNHITMILANLATHIADPIQRLKIIQQSMQQDKNRFAQMSNHEILAYSGLRYGPIGIQVVGGLFPRHQSFNIVISSFINSENPLYLNGAQLEALYPASIVLDGQAMNITFSTYMKQLDVGIMACRHTLPKVQKMLHYLEQTIQQYEQLIHSDSCI